MPTREETEAAIVDIERTLSKYPGQRIMQFVQMQDHEWPGFCIDEQRMVIGRVLGFDPKDQWMSGLEIEMNLEEIKATQGWKRSMELDAYLDAAPEREIEQWYDWMESQPDEIQEDAANLLVRPLTEQLIAAAHLDFWPGNAAIIDFGIDSDRHFGALQYAIKYGEVTPQELDAAMGSGAKLTQIAQRGDNPYRDVTFHTSWDSMSLEPPEELGPDEAKAIFAEIRQDEHAARVRDYGDEVAPDTEKILFEKILHGTSTPETKQERGSKEKEIDHEQ